MRRLRISIVALAFVLVAPPRMTRAGEGPWSLRAGALGGTAYPGLATLGAHVGAGRAFGRLHVALKLEGDLLVRGRVGWKYERESRSLFPHVDIAWKPRDWGLHVMCGGAFGRFTVSDSDVEVSSGYSQLGVGAAVSWRGLEVGARWFGPPVDVQRPDRGPGFYMSYDVLIVGYVAGNYDLPL